MKKIGTKEEGDLNTLKKYQEELCKLNNDFKEFNFNWKDATTEYVEMKSETAIYEWLYPIKFCGTLAFILEILQENVDDILIDRAKSFKLICFSFNISLEFFYEIIEKIQELLIKFEKVKVCKDGKVIIMNNVW